MMTSSLVQLSEICHLCGKLHISGFVFRSLLHAAPFRSEDPIVVIVHSEFQNVHSESCDSPGIGFRLYWAS